jgi:hypothetical protein
LAVFETAAIAEFTGLAGFEEGAGMTCAKTIDPI